MKNIANIKYYVKAMRIHHYLKNLLVFAPLFCNRNIFDLEKLKFNLSGFFAFCFASSAIYIVNDLKDSENDRMHPTKKNRPIASGKISKPNACIFAASLIILAGIFNFLAFNWIGTFLLALYFFLNMAYSTGLKNVPLLDIAILVSGFLIRVFYGATISNIEISNWFYLTVLAISLYLALGKRRNELKQSKNLAHTRKVLSFYSENFLDKNMYMCLALANVFYTLWSIDEKTLEAQNGKYLVWTAPLFLFITMKYSLNVECNSDGDPVEVFLKDKALLILSAFYLTAIFFILYLQNNL